MSTITDNLKAMAAAAATKHGIDPGLFSALIGAESAWNPKAVSHVGAQGLGQLMPSTARGLGVSNPFDPRQNLDGSARYLAGLLQRFGGDQTKAVAAYNAGPGAVDKYGGIPPFAETQAYVAKVLGGAQQAPGGSAQPTTSLDPANISRLLFGASTSPAPPALPAGVPDLSTLQANTKANLAGLSPQIKSALASAADELQQQSGIDLGPLITSAFRSSADQARLYANRANNPNPVAPPGRSQHERGGAIDISISSLPPDLQQTITSTLGKYGLYRPMPDRDPVHWQLQAGARPASPSAPQTTSLDPANIASLLFAGSPGEQGAGSS